MAEKSTAKDSFYAFYSQKSVRSIIEVIDSTPTYHKASEFKNGSVKYDSNIYANESRGNLWVISLSMSNRHLKQA